MVKALLTSPVYMNASIKDLLAVVTKSSFFSGFRILKAKTKFVNSFLPSIAQVRACSRVIAAKKVTTIFNKLPLL